MKSKEQHRKYNLQYYYNKRNKLIQKLGGHCVMCGSTENLEFDHINSSDKSFGVGAHMQYGEDHLQPELDKCQLLCHNCHIQKTKIFKDSGVKIDKDIANLICEEYATSNITQKQLGEKYGLAQTTIGCIVRGTRWATETAEFDRNKILTKDVSGSTKPKIAVDKIDPNTGKVIQTYLSMNDAERDGYKCGAISRCCNGKLKHHGGFIWKKH